eukprot:gene8367-9221_t
MGSLPPGPEILKSSLMPFAQSMEEALRGSQTLVHLLLLPALLGTVHCFLFAASQQLRAMACSGLVPADLKQPWQRLARQRSKLSTRSLRNFLKAVVRNRAGAAYIYPSALQSVFTSRREGFATAADDTPSERLSVGTVVPEEIIHHHPVQRRPMQQVRDDSYTLIQTFGACQECEEPQACQEEMPSLVSMSVAE